MTAIPSTSSRLAAARAQRIVVKVGSAVLTGGAPTLDRAYLHDLAAQIAGLTREGRRVIVVSSGAVATGLAPLKMTSRPRDVAGQQAAAAAGQPLLMSLWNEAFAVRSVSVAQVLLGRGDFDSRERFLNIRNCLSRLLEHGAVPIINENDTVATDEISLGDNDLLSAKIAAAVQAELLVILTGVGGVLDSAGNVVSESAGVEPLLPLVRTEKSAQGRGGMTSKLAAARAANLSGVSTIIAQGRPADSFARACRGENVGTLIAAPSTCGGSAEARIAGKRVWIGLGVTPTGAILIDDGAARAVREKGASLLARGITGVQGDFEVGDAVHVRQASTGRDIARGLSNFSSREALKIVGVESSRFEEVLGRQAHEEVVHRDNMVVGE
ncbi:MAG: glutamate 5-kinase [Phycisphaerales bacterium]